MKKFLLTVLVMSVVMAFAGMSVAAESENVNGEDIVVSEAADLAATTSVVGEDIVIGEGEMKIVSLPVDEGEGGGTDAAAPLTPEELLMEEQKRVDEANEVVADDGSVSIENDPSLVMVPVEGGDAPVSNSDSPDELSDEQLADLAAQSGVVGEDIEIAEGEAKIVSLPEGEADDMAKTIAVDEEVPFNWPLAAGIAGGVVILGGVIFLLIKKSKMTATAA